MLQNNSSKSVEQIRGYTSPDTGDQLVIAACQGLDVHAGLVQVWL
jgi:hypothetical protein